MIVQTGQALGFGVIAEGVETEDQVALLQSIGCESAQGYGLGHPLDPAGIAVPKPGTTPMLGQRTNRKGHVDRSMSGHQQASNSSAAIS